MLIHARANIPLQSDSLVQALSEFAVLVRQYFATRQNAEISIAIGESGARANEVLARYLPGDTKEFGLGMLPIGPPLTGGQFRESIALGRPKKTRSQIRVSAAAIPDLSALLDDLAGVLPPSGRGIMLLVNLTGWQIAGDDSAIAPAADATFSWFRKGARPLSASAGIRFHALSLKDPVVAETIAAASERTKLRFGKPVSSFPANTIASAQPSPRPDPRLLTPAPDAQLVVLLSFEEAMARAADQIGARPEDLANVPMLFSRSSGFGKRMRDAIAGKKESVNLPSRVKRFMKELFPHYRFDESDPQQLRFRKPLASTLDLILVFNRVHQWGLGKTFSVEFGADFPNTPFGGMHAGVGGTSKNIFWLFHEGWERQVWAYSTSDELSSALEGCGELLRRILPAAEEQCRQLLLPPPAALPAGIATRGALSAREAYDLILPMAREWAADAQLESLGSTNVVHISGPVGSLRSSISEEGRLRPHGSWALKFVSKRLDRCCAYFIPHTGRVWWSFYPVLQGALPKYSAILDSDEWIDSTAVAPQALQAAQQPGEDRAYEISLVLRDPQRYAGNFVWEATCMSHGDSPSDRRQVVMQFDRRTGKLKETVVR
jgi:hypothetical protein